VESESTKESDSIKESKPTKESESTKERESPNNNEQTTKGSMAGKNSHTQCTQCDQLILKAIEMSLTRATRLDLIPNLL
jgi:hypothetical protein